METLEDLLRDTKSDEYYLLVNLGNALVRLGQKEKANASFDRAIELKPNCSEAWHNRGNVLKNLGRDEEAKVSFGRVIQTIANKVKPDKYGAENN